MQCLLGGQRRSRLPAEGPQTPLRVVTSRPSPACPENAASSSWTGRKEVQRTRGRKQGHVLDSLGRTPAHRRGYRPPWPMTRSVPGALTSAPFLGLVATAPRRLVGIADAPGPATPPPGSSHGRRPPSYRASPAGRPPVPRRRLVRKNCTVSRRSGVSMLGHPPVIPGEDSSLGPTP